MDLASTTAPTRFEPFPSGPSLAEDDWQRLLRQHNLMRPLAKALLLDQIAAAVQLEDEQQQQLVRQFLAGQQVDNEATLQQWLQQQRLSLADLYAMATRAWRLLRYSESRFAAEVESRFLDRKLQLDQITYSLIRVDDVDLARELHQMIKEGEADFPELAPLHSSGPEARSRGVVGPISLAAAHPELMARLRVAQPGQLLDPFCVTDLWLVVRLEQHTPAQLDDAMRQQLLQELLELWLQQQVELLLSGEPLPAIDPIPA